MGIKELNRVLEMYEDDPVDRFLDRLSFAFRSSAVGALAVTAIFSLVTWVHSTPEERAVEAREDMLNARGYYDCTGEEPGCDYTNKVLETSLREPLRLVARRAKREGSSTIDVPPRDQLNVPLTAWEVERDGENRVIMLPNATPASSDHGTDRRASLEARSGFDEYFSALGGKLVGDEATGQRVEGGPFGADQGAAKVLSYRVGGVSYTVEVEITAGDAEDIAVMNESVMSDACDDSRGKAEAIATYDPTSEEGNGPSFKTQLGCTIPVNQGRG